MVQMHYDVACALVGRAEKEEAVRRVLEAVSKGLGWQLGVLFEVDDTGESLAPTVSWELPEAASGLVPIPVHQRRLRRGEGLAGRAWCEKGLVVAHGGDLEANFLPEFDLTWGASSSGVFFPVRTAGAVHGVVALASRGHEPRSQLCLRTLETVGRQLGQYLERLRSERAHRAAEQRLRDELERRVAERTAALEAEIAERRRVEVELLASEARFQTLSRSNVIGIEVSDFSGRIRDGNEEFFRIIGHTREEIQSGTVSWKELTPPEWRGADDNAIRQLKLTGSCAPYSKEYVRRDGTRVPIIIGVALLDRARGECVCFVIDDTLRRNAEAKLEGVNRDLERRVRERTASLVASEARAGQAAAALARSERQLRRLAAHLQRVREDERTQLAREIHDVLGQELTGLKMDAAWLMRRLRSPTSTTKAMAERLATMESSIDSAITTVRRIATDLRPGMLDDLGLVPALQWQVREYERRFGLTVTFSGPPEDVDVDRPHATAMFRILQELLTNIARHAHAKTVAVNLTATDERLLLEVRDDGRGISDAELSGARSLGLLGMRERAAALGGTCWIAGKPGSGTVARVDLPRADGGPS